MGELFGQILVVILIFVGLYVLYRKGIIRRVPLPTPFFMHWKGRRSISARFWKFGDDRVYVYYLRDGEEYTFRYDVAIKQGEVILSVRNGSRETLFKEAFTDDAKGKVTFRATNRFHEIVLSGKNGRGSVKGEFIETSS